jgi:release factor glutamine methyltransferase
MNAAELLKEAAARFAAGRLDEPRREARLLLALALDCDASHLLDGADRAITVNETARFEAFVARRLRHEPYSRIAGKREFWSLEFALSPDTLDPRADSETLIETALTLIPDRAAPLRILDLGTGSGALLLALLSELPSAWGVGVDIAPGAGRTARRNAAALGLDDRGHFLAGDWSAALRWQADLILANPPYIKAEELDHLAREVALYDPKRALDGGFDGLQAYREIAAMCRESLRPGGYVVLEIGAGRTRDVEAIMVKAGFGLLTSRHDLGGIERCLVFGSWRMSN